MNAIVQNIEKSNTHLIAESVDIPLVSKPIINPISLEQIRQAKELAQQQQRRVIEVLEDLSDLDQESFLQAISQSLHFPAINMKELNQLEVDFDVIAFSTALQKECLAFIDDVSENRSLILVFADPFNETLQEWAIENIRRPMIWCLAHRKDIAAYLARHEETMRDPPA